MQHFGEKTLIWKVNHALKKLDLIESQNALLRETLGEVLEQAEIIDEKRDEAVKKKMDKEWAKLYKRIEELEGGPRVQADQVAISRAKTFAIFDSILFAIENWATDDSPASDFTIISQSVLFPVVLEKVSRNDEDYYLTEVPTGALEVVRRGREFIQQYRQDDKITMLDPNVFPIVQAELQDWWTRDALGLLYGATDHHWQKEEPFSFEQMNRWRMMEAARPLEFPLLFDGMELVQRYGDEIREETGLPDFSRTAMKLRLHS
jgi:hypothetical protein